MTALAIQNQQHPLTFAVTPQQPGRRDALVPTQLEDSAPSPSCHGKNAGLMRAATLGLALLGVTSACSDVSSPTGPEIPEPPVARTPTEIMGDRPFAPNNANLFLPGIYPSAIARPPAPARVLGEQEVRDKLVAYANQDPNLSSGEALDIFNDPIAKEKIPNPSLRAALAALQGTIGEPAIDFILNAKMPDGSPAVLGAIFCTTEQLSNPNFIAEAFIVLDTNQLIICFNNRYIGENPFLFTAMMSHETGHQDPVTSTQEEIVMTAIDAYIYLNQILNHPDLVSGNTELSQSMNARALSRLNSGMGSELGLVSTNGDNPVLPESQFSESSFADLWEAFLGSFGPASTPGNALLGQYLQELQETGKMSCSAEEFSEVLVQCMSENNGDFSAEDGVAAAEALELDI